jgi:hypothetical protein
MVDDTKPAPDDLRTDDQEFNPTIEPKKSRAWLNLLQESEDAFERWNMHCDKIDKQFADLERLSSVARDKEYQMFWANCEVVTPAIYAKPPVPVVVPKFKDRRPLFQAASEVMERTCVVAFDIARINDIMIQARDDLAIAGRGVIWCRYDSGEGVGGYGNGERVCYDFKTRRDFLHSLSRSWAEVGWVAGASYLTRGEARKRFQKTSGDSYQDVDYQVDRYGAASGGADARERGKFWEIWDKANQRVVWVAEGCDVILDEDDPHLDLANFFPCPQPAYGTCQRGSLVPVPDVLQYRDQLEEINLLTSRIHALSDALEVKGFYPAGGTELADAIQTAVTSNTPGRLLVPIKNWAAFGGTSEVIIWMPIDIIAKTITGLVDLRTKIIDDIYQITGMADIMRGDTDPQETLGAQQLKTQYGSSRIRDKQNELVRLARDLVEITSEIITSQFDPVTIIEMSQTQLSTDQMIEQQAQQMMQQNPQAAQQIVQQSQQQVAQQIQELHKQPTIDQVLRFLSNNRAKSFVLDIETDSTILSDENAEKQRRGEFVQMLGGLLPQLASMIGAEPKTATFCGELIKFSVAPFRAGRSLDGAIDELVQLMEEKGTQQQGDDPTTATNKTAVQIEQMKLTYAKQKDDADRALKERQLQQQAAATSAKTQSENARVATEVQGRAQEHAAKVQAIQAKAAADLQESNQDMREHQVDTALQVAKMHAEAQQNTQANLMAQQHAAQQQFKMPKGGRLIP